MAPVMSSVTVACCVRSPSATACSSFISRRMAAWLASLTRLASCSWRSASRRCAFGELRALAWSRTYRRRNPQPPASSSSAETAAATRSQARRSRVSRQALLHRLAGPCAAARCRPGSRPALRAPRPGPAGCPGWRSACAARSLVLLDQRCQALRGLRVRGAGQAQFGVAVDQALGDLAERVQVLAEQEHRLGAHAFDGQELVGGLADALRQHHQLADGRQFGGRGVLLQLQRRTPSRPISSRSADWRLMARSAWPTCGQRLLLAPARRRRSSRRGRPAAAAARACPAPPRGLPAAAVAGRRPRTLRPARRRFPCTSGKACGAADQRLRHRLGQPLRLHQRLADGADLVAAAAGRAQRQHRAQHQAEQPSARSRRAGCAAAAAPAGGRSAAAPRPGAGRRRRDPAARVSLKSPAISDGATSEMMDESCRSWGWRYVCRRPAAGCGCSAAMSRGLDSG